MIQSLLANETNRFWQTPIEQVVPDRFVGVPAAVQPCGPVREGPRADQVLQEQPQPRLQ